MSIDPTKWFWLVGNKPDQAFSGPEAAYVALDDAGYVAFLDAGTVATSILSDGELADVLTKRDMPPTMIAAAGWTDWGNVPLPDRMAAALAAGVSVVSTGTPALDATYPASGAEWRLMVDTAQYIAIFSAFPGGLSELEWPSVGGAVTFSTPPQFLAVVRGIGDYQALWQRFVNGHAEEPPTPPVTIA